MIEARYTLTEGEYIEAQAAYAKATQRNTLYGLAVLVLASFVLYFATNPAKLEWKGLIDGRMLPVAVIVLSPVWLPLLRRWGLKRRYRVELQGLTGLIVLLDEAGYTVTSAEQGNAFVPWSALFAYIETKNLFLILKGFSFRPIPKRALSEDEQAKARNLITTHLPKLTRKLAKSQGR